MGLCKKQRDTPARGTSWDYQHVTDVPLTRANIESVQRQRVKEGRPTYSVGGIVRLFVHFPEERHFLRAERLMT